MTHKIVYIDFDVQDHVSVTHRLDDNMMYILTRVNLRNTLAIVCAATAFIHTFPSNPHDAFRYPIMPYFGKIKPIRVRHTFATIHSYVLALVIKLQASSIQASCFQDSWIQASLFQSSWLSHRTFNVLSRYKSSSQLQVKTIRNASCTHILN